MAIYVRNPDDGSYTMIISDKRAVINLKGYSITNDIYASNDSEVSVTTYTPTKVKEMKLSDISNATLRIYFELKWPQDTYYAYGQIYRNGSPVGTLRGSQGGYYQGFTEDIDGWNDGDYLQLYLWCDEYGPLWTAYARNLRILGMPYLNKFTVTNTL